MSRPLLYGAAFYTLGCLLGDAAAATAEVLVALALAAALVVLALLGAGARACAAALAVAAFAAGWAGASVCARAFESGELRQLAQELHAAGADATAALVRGSVAGAPFERDGRLVLELNVDSATWRERKPTRGTVRLEVGGEQPRPLLRDGDRLEAWVKLRPAGVEGQRDAVDAYAFCKSARLLRLLPRAEPGPLRAAVAATRARFRDALVRALPKSPERGLVLAMVLGDRSELDEETAEAFRASGTYHVLALSGAQVALLAGLTVGGLRRLVVRPIWQAVITGGLLGFYTALVGGDVPVVRASLMASAVLAGRVLELDTDVPNLLGLAALALLAYRPAWAGDVGFQLSFAATLAILLLTGPLTRGLPRLPLRAEIGLAASLAAQAALAPILAATFHRLAPAALLLNIVAVPASSAVLLCGLVVVGVSPLGSTAGDAAGALAWAAARVLRISGDLGPLAPWLDVRVPAPSPGSWAACAVGLALLGRQRRGAGLALLALVHVALVWGPFRPAADGRLHLVTIDVGQGDSLLLVSPSGRGLLVDAGGSRDARFDPGERRVAPELWSRGLRRLDSLLVTHAHPDHVGGAPFLLRAFRTRELWEGPAPLRDPAWQRVRAALPRGPVRRSVAAGVGTSWDGVQLTVLGPAPPARAPRRIRNEDSVVLDVAYGDVHLLLTGDVTGDAERQLRVARSTVLKVPHHGSASSTGPQLLAAAQPRVAVVSAGAHNPFGHPRPEVLERCLRAGALVLRTDRDGTIEVATDGRRVWVRTAAEPFERRVE